MAKSQDKTFDFMADFNDVKPINTSASPEPAKAKEIQDANAPTPSKRGRKPKKAVEEAKPKKNVTIYVDAEDWEMFIKVTKTKNISASQVIEKYVAKYLSDNHSIVDFILQLNN